MKTQIVIIGGKLKVKFKYGRQTFTLNNEGTREEMEWTKQMLDKCFAAFARDCFAVKWVNFSNRHPEDAERDIIVKDGNGTIRFFRWKYDFFIADIKRGDFISWKYV